MPSSQVESGASHFCKYTLQKRKLELDTKASGTMIMTPEDAQKLQDYIQGIAEILYKNTDSSNLVSMEAIEKTVRRQMLENVSPKVAFFSSNKLQEQQAERET